MTSPVSSTTAPSITSKSPASGATNVAVSSTIAATFNEAVQPSSISFTLKTGSTTVATTFSYNTSTNTATWTPTPALAYGTSYTATISAALSTSGTAMASPVSWSFATDPAAPKVTSESPTSGATGVAVTSPVSVTFNEAVQQSTIGFTLKNGSATVATNFSYNSTTHVATWTPTSALSNSTNYTASVTGALDTAGDPMAAPVTWSFTTVAAPAPAVTGETPESGATGVAVSPSITATFNEPVQSGTIGFTLASGSGNVSGSVTYNASTMTAIFTPGAALSYATTYKATVSGALSTAGVAMTSPFVWSFSTDTTPPAVTQKTPAAGATNVALATTVTATFNEAVQSSTIGFTLKNGSATVATNFSYNSTTHTATWTPTSALAYSTTYTASVTGALDTAGDPMNAPVTWSFTTLPQPPPAVISETPASGATGVAVSSPVTATFNEAVQSGTISFTLASGSGSVTGSVTYNASTNTATFTPSALAYATTYTATVSGAENASNVAMTAPFSWSFTTIAQPVSTGDPTTLAPSLGAPPSPGPNVIWVSTQTALQSAFSSLKSGQTIVIQPGTYNLSNTLYIGVNSNITNVTIRGSTDNFNDVTLLGKGMDNSSYGNVPMGISIYNAQNVTIADLSIGNVYFDPIEVKGDQGASAVTIYHVHLYDAGEQFIKADPPASAVGASNSAVEYSMIDYSNGPPTTDHGGGIGYTNGIDIHDGANWLIAHNLIENLHTPDSDPAANLWNPAILIWNHSSNMTVDGNTIINCDRAIAFGLIDQSSGYDNQGGIIRNNFIYQAPGLFSTSRAAASDGQIIVWDSPSSQVLFNTILTDGNSANSIQLRFTTTGAVVDDNLSDASIRARDNATYTSSGNYLSATPSMFVNPSTGDLHLVSNSATLAHVIDQVVALANDPNDWNGNSRTVGSLTDIGADATLSSTDSSQPATSASLSQGITNAAAGLTTTATLAPGGSLGATAPSSQREVIKVARSHRRANGGPGASIGGQTPVAVSHGKHVAQTNGGPITLAATRWKL